jgi:transcriptional regulator with GAF, ATPase, and Fis domain
MKQFNRIIERLKVNEEISDKFFAIETEILRTLNFQDLFNILLSAIREKFEIPFVCLALIDDSELSALVKSIVEPRVLEGNVSFAKSELLEGILQGNNAPVFINENLENCHPLFPWMNKAKMRSLAVVPLFIDGKLCGSLNQADPSLTRFRPGIDGKFLSRLATMISISLSNVTAHERLRLVAQKQQMKTAGK